MRACHSESWKDQETQSRLPMTYSPINMADMYLKGKRESKLRPGNEPTYSRFFNLSEQERQQIFAEALQVANETRVREDADADEQLTSLAFARTVKNEHRQNGTYYRLTCQSPSSFLLRSSSLLLPACSGPMNTLTRTISANPSSWSLEHSILLDEFSSLGEILNRPSFTRV